MKRSFLSLLAVVIACMGLSAQDARDIFITGDATEYGWSYSNSENSRVTQQSDGTYSWSGTLKQDGRFRFLVTNKWYPTYTTAATSHQVVSDGTYPITYDASSRPNEPSFRVANTGEYTITLDLEALEMHISLDKKAEEYEHIYIVGSGCPAGWSTGAAIELRRLENGHYSWTGDLTKENEGRFRFITSRNWYPSYTTAEAGHTLVKAGQYALTYYEAGVPGEPSFKVEIPGNYTVDLDLDKMIMSLTPNSIYEEKSLYIMGNAINGLDADGEMPVAEMHLTGDDLFEWTGELYPETVTGAPAMFKFTPDPQCDITYTCRTDIDGNEEVCGNETYDLFEKTAGEGMDNWFYPSVPGRYTIVADMRLMTISVIRHKSELYLVGSAVNGANAPWGFNEKYLSKMSETASPMVFEWSGNLYANSADGKVAKFKFLTTSGAWTGFVNGADEDTTVEYDGIYPLLDSTLPGAGDRQFMVPADGFYHLTVDTRALTLSVTAHTSGLESDNIAPTVNTRLEKRRLFFESDTTADIAVYDIAGRSIASASASSGSIEFPTAGIFIVRINNSISKIAVK